MLAIVNQNKISITVLIMPSGSWAPPSNPHFTMVSLPLSGSKIQMCSPSSLTIPPAWLGKDPPLLTGSVSLESL